MGTELSRYFIDAESHIPREIKPLEIKSKSTPHGIPLGSHGKDKTYLLLF